jgi:transposase
MLESPNYYAILPANVRYDKELKPMEKIIYAEITALANIKGYCYASNLYFAKLYDVSKETVSRWIGNLEKEGYVKTKLIREEKKIKERRIYVTPIDKKINTPIDEKINTPIDKKIKDNITRFNTTSINNIYTFWNKQKIIEHRKLTNKMRNKIKSTLKEYKEEEIKQSIKNYAEILNSKKYWFSYRWTIDEFLNRGLEKFMNGEIAKQNYLDKAYKEQKQEGSIYDNMEVYR